MASDSKKSRVEQQIDENLKRVYDDAMKDELPDRFLDLIAQLKASEGAAKDGK
ncbi:NepR family anti-sigma factor [Gymnodinialimonas hymeniacidonis]|uniref:NepR family anti-sigma factor n=1 Tax=Gymnodinialimonas hymeniacidonis TaxID=3126508 RepID=UPI0034C62EEE